jgi:CDP-diacylglycerol--serine O-phosphatidyltransferase
VLFVRVGRRRNHQARTATYALSGSGQWPGGDLQDGARSGGKLLTRIAVRPRRSGPLGPTAPFRSPFPPAPDSGTAAGILDEDVDLTPGRLRGDEPSAPRPTELRRDEPSALRPTGLRGDEPSALRPTGLRGDEPSAPRPIPLLPGEQTLARKLRFVLVNGCTMTSLGLGLAAIFLSMHGDVRWAALCLVGCVSLDGLDGALARRLGVASPFGAQLDSMADMCSFGIAAPVVVYAGLHGSAPAALVGAACALVATCAGIRLARFNVSPKDGRFFCGVPTTTVAAVLGLGILIGLRPSGSVTVAALAVLALAMVSGFPYAKLGRLAKLPPWLWLVPAVGALLDYRVTFAALVALYLVSGPVLWLKYRPR